MSEYGFKFYCPFCKFITRTRKIAILERNENVDTYSQL